MEQILDFFNRYSNLATWVGLPIAFWSIYLTWRGN